MEDHSSSSVKGGGITMINWFPKLVETQVNLISTTLTSLITPPTEKPSSTDFVAITQQIVKRVSQGVLGAVYVGMVLSLVMLVAVILGVLMVNSWVEEPVFVRHKMYFDYTEVNPQALVVFGGGKKGQVGVVVVPVGHMFCVSVELLLPDSDYNRDIGVFQLTAEVISTNGKVIARSSQPSMLRFQSRPIRLMRTFAMGLPLMLGLTRETQKISVHVLNYKETTHLRTGAIKITLMPRAGTLYLPQLYEAEILMQSKLPRLKELVYNWKWTFYVWTSSYIYILLLLLLVYFFKPLLVYPISRGSIISGRPRATLEREENPDSRLPEDRELTESLRKWQQYRKKRKEELLGTGRKGDIDFYEDVGGSMSASSYTVTKDDIAPGIEEDVGDSESICN